MNRSFIAFVLIALLSVVLTSGCGAEAPADEASLADFDTPVPDSVARHIPLPEQASVIGVSEQEGQTTVMFSPGVGWLESLQFFAQVLPVHGWHVESESLPELNEADREATWIARGHNHRLTVTITAYGGSRSRGLDMNGILLLEESN